MNKKVIIGIITLVVIIGAVICLVLMAGNNKESSIIDTKEETKKAETNIKKEEKNNIETWGVQEEIVAKKNDKFSNVYIKFPTLSGIRRGTGKIAYQKDKTLVILDAEMKQVFPNITANSCEEVFPAYFEQTKAIIDAYRQMNYDNFEFSVDSKETVNINGYEMCKYIGKHTFTFKNVNTFETENISMNFVAYATQLKTNGAYVYWMVLDESENQSLTSTIEDYAYKMALTFKEQ